MNPEAQESTLTSLKKSAGDTIHIEVKEMFIIQRGTILVKINFTSDDDQCITGCCLHKYCLGNIPIGPEENPVLCWCNERNTLITVSIGNFLLDRISIIY